MNKYFKRSILATAILGMLGGHAKALSTNDLSLGIIPITEENAFEKTEFYRENPEPIPPRVPDDIDNGGNVYPGKTEGIDKNNISIDEDDRQDSGKTSNISNESEKIPYTGDYRNYYLYIMLMASVFTLSRYKKYLK